MAVLRSLGEQEEVDLVSGQSLLEEHAIIVRKRESWVNRMCWGHMEVL